jgi:hypothetical protein
MAIIPLFVGAIIGDDALKDKNKAALGRRETTGPSTTRRTRKKRGPKPS